MAKERLNNFQRAETARWLLNLSQAAAVGGVGSLFIPGIDRFGIIGPIASTVLALLLYELAMVIGKGVKDDKWLIKWSTNSSRSTLTYPCNRHNDLCASSIKR